MDTITTNRRRCLSGFALKYIALVCMVFDHIHYFFSFTGKAPLFFSWIGRLAAPLFLFCIVEGFIHTRDRKKYFLRIYLISVLMGLIQFSFYNIGHALVRGDGFFPQNQMLASFAILIVILQGIDWCAEKKWLRGITAVLIPLALPFIILSLLAVCNLGGYGKAAFVVNLLAFTVLPCHLFIIDGGTATIICGCLLYLFRKHRTKQAAAYIVFVFLWDFVRVLFYLKGNASAAIFFSEAYEWMEVFAVIPMLCYNGTRGRGAKRLFYWFYPAHIYILYALSCIVYNSLYIG
ncbi:MAG: conjugal transfer protein TraX [Bacillus sp. (in: Bacteria)]|nr:conjugal transfer protein TraX [Bacillus sp. (in: firmicutes)]MCM1427303.1 conjugal transfer protein TraX [Eubacterium sp.]